MQCLPTQRIIISVMNVATDNEITPILFGHQRIEIPECNFHHLITGMDSFGKLTPVSVLYHFEERRNNAQLSFVMPDSLVFFIRYKSLIHQVKSRAFATFHAAGM